jgi:toxin-antitoxin system PIN domain toxin
MYLLDVNVLVAILDPQHVSHSVCLRWFLRNSAKGWATCPLTENGLVRVLIQPAVGLGRFRASDVLDLIADFRRHKHHVWLLDDVSLCDEDRRFTDRISRPDHVSDAYLLSLCRRSGLKLATQDHKLEPALAPGEGLVEAI